MNERHLTDARIAVALRAHVPAEVTPGLSARVMEAVLDTRQQRPLPGFLRPFDRLGAVSAGQRREVLLAALLLLALALAGAAAIGALRFLEQRSAPPLEVDVAQPAVVEALCATQPGACVPLEVQLRSFARGAVDRGTMPPTTPTGAANGWIAYSTDPAVVTVHQDDPYSPNVPVTNGSDLYLVREGGDPIRIADRSGGTTWNACPAFSPDGSRLAFGVTQGSERAMVVLEVDAAAGVVGEPLRIAVPGPGPIACPRWSSDSERLGYLDGSTVMMHGLDGSTTTPSTDDPSPADFASDPTRGGLYEGDPSTEPILSPSGDRTVRLEVSGDCQLVLATPDEAGARVIRLGGGVGERHVDPLTRCPYAVASWSPDGRQVLIMQDVGRHEFTMVAVSVEPPYTVTTVASRVRTNAGEWDSWPGYGDVSWQPVRP